MPMSSSKKASCLAGMPLRVGGGVVAASILNPVEARCEIPLLHLEEAAGVSSPENQEEILLQNHLAQR